MSRENGCGFRHELKYAISPAQREDLRGKLGVVMKPDSHAGPAESYHVRSIYFDDFKDTALMEKLAGVMRRKKYRLRMYDFDDSLVKLERKVKVDQCVHKEVALLSRSDAERILSGDVSFLVRSEKGLMREFYADHRLGMLKPVVIVDYYREAYASPMGNTRVTFDTRLSTSLGTRSFFSSAPRPLKAVDAPEIILELKFDDLLPQTVRGVFPDTIRPKSAIGKFAICRSQQLRMMGFAN